MPGVSIHWAALDRFPVGWRFPRHRHGLVELIVVLAGRLQTEMGGEIRVAGPGDVVIHPEGRDHQEAALGGRPLETIYTSFVAPAAADLATLPWQRDDRSGRIEAALRWAVDAFTDGTPAGRATAGSLVDAALYEFGRAADPDAELVARVRAHVVPRLGQALTLGHLAAAAGLSRYHFARRFRAATGQPPMAWLRDLRLARARHLLATRDLTVEQVGIAVGFGDRFHFSRAMRRGTGRPPSGWRRA